VGGIFVGGILVGGGLVGFNLVGEGSTGGSQVAVGVGDRVGVAVGRLVGVQVGLGSPVAEASGVCVGASFSPGPGRVGVGTESFPGGRPSSNGAVGVTEGTGVSSPT
jgi:hypothetical protein